MPALPTVFGSRNVWATNLNEFLRVSHNEDGTLKSSLSPVFAAMSLSGILTIAHGVVAMRITNDAGSGSLNFIQTDNGGDILYICRDLASGANINLGHSHADANPIYIRVNSSNGQQITVGAIDSGGAGFRVLRVPN